MPNQNFTTRPLTLEDAQIFVDTLKVISADTGTNRSYQPDFIQAQWQEPNFDITKSSNGIFTDDGQLAGYVVIWDTKEQPVRPWIEWGVHPDFLDYDLSTQLLQWADKTSQRIIDRCPPDARLSLHSSIVKGYTPMEKALAQAGYIAIRSEYEMRIDMEIQPTAPNPPDGFTVRTYNDDEDLHALVHAFRDSFSDHFGHVEQPLEKHLEEFRHWFATDEIDPTLIFLAIDEKSDEVAGYVLGMKGGNGDSSAGYIDLVGVRRAYRRRGLAQTLLQHSFNEFWNRDQKSVTLEVDGSSLTNAVTLYERVGMVIKFQYVRYEKLMRDGQELAKVSAD
jgi:mycothiol synthase